MAKIGIFVGTVYGNALLVAEEAEPALQQQGHDVKIFEDPTLAEWQNYANDVALVITSTTGQGDFRILFLACSMTCRTNWATSQGCATALLPWATAATRISAVRVSALMPCYRSIRLNG